MRTRGLYPWYTDRPITLPSSSSSLVAGLWGGNDTGFGFASGRSGESPGVVDSEPGDEISLLPENILNCSSCCTPSCFFYPYWGVADGWVIIVLDVVETFYHLCFQRLSCCFYGFQVIKSPSVTKHYYPSRPPGQATWKFNTTWITSTTLPRLQQNAAWLWISKKNLRSAQRNWFCRGGRYQRPSTLCSMRRQV